VVWRWQERFMQAGVDGLLRDKTRPSRKPPLDQAVIARVIEWQISRDWRSSLRTVPAFGCKVRRIPRIAGVC
jgi:hypothetical protein